MKTREFRLTVSLIALAVVFSAVVGFDLFWRGLHRYPVSPEWHIDGADAERGREAMAHYGCGACHVIPGVRGARGRVGPKLEDFADQIYIAGRLANVPENLVAWIQDPDTFSPGTAMPDLNVTEEEARDMAAYLYGRR